MKLILVPTDMSETASHALRYASALAQRLGAHLLVLYADPFVPPGDLAGTTAFAVRRGDVIEAAHEQLELIAEENIDRGVPYDVRVVSQSPIDAILEQACDTGADLIVMGTHGRTGLSRLLIGSVTEAIIRLATVPVIAVNAFAGEKSKMNKVVVPVTFTTESLEALRYAAALSGDASLLLLRGIEGTEVIRTIDELIALEDWIPKELLNRAEMKVVPKPISAEEIVEFEKNNHADMIALGVPSPHVVEKILHLSPCPVLTMNERTVALRAPNRKLPLSAVAAAR